MTGLRTLLGDVTRWASVGLALAAAVVLFAPIAAATPESDADAAIGQAWDAGGGDTGPLGPKDGDVYPIGAGFGQNFAGGKVYFTPETGAHIMLGAILDKYLSLGGPADGDLGFPTIDEGDGQGARQSEHHVQRGRQPGDLLHARHRCARGPRRDQRGVGQARRIGGRPRRAD